MTENDTGKPSPSQNSQAVDLRAEDASLRQEAARQMGRATSERKSAAVRENGKKGGRPRGTQTSPEAKARMKEAQKQRRAMEQESKPKSAEAPPAS